MFKRENVGSVPFKYDISDFDVKDADGFAYSYNVLYTLLSPLLSGDLPPNEEVRGDIAYDVKKPNGKRLLSRFNLFKVFSSVFGIKWKFSFCSIVTPTRLKSTPCKL